MSQRFSHVALTVPRRLILGAEREQLLRFYGDVFGWQENERFAIPGERILLRAPTNTQYLTIRGSEQPMQTSGYEHLGVWVDGEDELRELHTRAEALAGELSGVELQPIQIAYDGALASFRLRFRLPLTLEVQHLRGG